MKLKHDHNQHPESYTNDHFPRPLDVREVGNGKWQLLEDFIYYDDKHGEIRVPRGFISDLYSIPRVVRSLVSKVQSSNSPAVVHDWLYRAQIMGKDGRKEADAMLERAMKNHWCPVSWWKRKKIMTGLKIGGSFSYKQRAQDLEDYSFLKGMENPMVEQIKKIR